MSTECELCDGRGEVQISKDGTAEGTDYYGCPACISRERDEETESLRAKLVEVSAQRNASNRKIEELTDQLAEVTMERDDYKQAVDDLGLTPEEARAGAKRSRDMKQQLLATQAQLVELQEENARLREDAENYRWLREQHWSDSSLCVVENPRDAVKLGHNCPYRAHLDALIHAARKEQK